LTAVPQKPAVFLHRSERQVSVEILCRRGGRGDTASMLTPPPRHRRACWCTICICRQSGDSLHGTHIETQLEFSFTDQRLLTVFSIYSSFVLPGIFEFAAAACPKKPRSSSRHRHTHSEAGTRIDFAGSGALKFPVHAEPQQTTESELSSNFFMVCLLRN
jgi:hypothetical protein